MKIDICTLFPQVFESYCCHGVLGQAIRENRISIATHAFRDFDAEDDGPVIRGRGGKLLRHDIVTRCVQCVQEKQVAPGHLIMLSPHGRPLTQDVVTELANQSHLVLLCGRFGGFESQTHTALNADEISVGEYILNGGEVAAMVILDAVIRLIPGVLDGTSRARRSRDAMGVVQ